MSTPRMNPLASQMLGGREFREKLRESLLERAAQTDDPAFRKRLESIANGRRPLRTLLADPAFRAELDIASSAARESTPASPVPEGTPEEVVHRMRSQTGLDSNPIPGIDEAQAVYQDALLLAEEAQAVIADEEAHGWGGTVERLHSDSSQADESDPMS